MYFLNYLVSPGRGLNPKLPAPEAEIYHYITKLIFSISFPFVLTLQWTCLNGKLDMYSVKGAELQIEINILKC